MIGILTLSAAENYGAVLQCHSLCEYINENYESAEIIDYTPEFIIGRYKWFSINYNNIVTILQSGLKSLLKFPMIFLKKYRFWIFRKNVSHYSSKKYIKTINEDTYNLYIVGSDQVWNLELTQWDLTYFLPFCHEEIKKSSYAASIGVDEIGNKETEIYKKYLSSFHYISVRESQGVEILSEIFPNKKIQQNIDSVFLHSFDYWSMIAAKRQIHCKYVLIYTFTAIDTAVEIAKKAGNGIDIYCINNSIRKIAANVKNVRGVGPTQFLSLIKEAEYIVTDSFHGMAFSIIFNKPFTVIPYEKTSSRMISMLKQLDLSDRLLSDNSYNLGKINYENVNTKLKTLIDEADNYIGSIISGVNYEYTYHTK